VAPATSSNDVEEHGSSVVAQPSKQKSSAEPDATACVYDFRFMCHQPQSTAPLPIPYTFPSLCVLCQSCSSIQRPSKKPRIDDFQSDYSGAQVLCYVCKLVSVLPRVCRWELCASNLRAGLWRVCSWSLLVTECATLHCEHIVNCVLVRGMQCLLHTLCRHIYRRTCTWWCWCWVLGTGCWVCVLSQDITTKPHISCVTCPNVQLCVECAVKDARAGEHELSHEYRVADNLSRTVDARFPDWTVDEHLRLLEGIRSFGFGNWRYVQAHTAHGAAFVSCECWCVVCCFVFVVVVVILVLLLVASAHGMCCFACGSRLPQRMRVGTCGVFDCVGWWCVLCVVWFTSDVSEHIGTKTVARVRDFYVQRYLHGRTPGIWEAEWRAMTERLTPPPPPPPPPAAAANANANATDTAMQSSSPTAVSAPTPLHTGVAAVPSPTQIPMALTSTSASASASTLASASPGVIAPSGTGTGTGTGTGPGTGTGAGAGIGTCTTGAQDTSGTPVAASQGASPGAVGATSAAAASASAPSSGGEKHVAGVGSGKTKHVKASGKARVSSSSSSSTNYSTPTVSAKVTKGAQPPKPHDIAGYLPLRGDFDVEHDNNAEFMLADMEFHDVRCTCAHRH